MFPRATILFAIASAAAACSGSDDCAVTAISTSPGVRYPRGSTMAIVRPNLYWSTPSFGADACGGGGLYVAPLSGGRSKRLSRDCVYSLAAANDRVYWLADPLYGLSVPEQLWSAPVPGGDGAGHVDLQRSFRTIHWAPGALLGAGTDGIVQIAPDGVFLGILVQYPLGFSTDAVVSDGANAYYIQTDFNSRLQQVMTVPLGGGSPLAIAAVACRDCLFEPLVDSGSILWIERDTDPSSLVSTGALMKASTGGGAVVELARGRLDRSQSAPHGLAVANGFVYWTDLDFHSGGTIEKTPMAGGETKALIAPRKWLADSIAVDDRYLYFIGVADGADVTAEVPPDFVIYRACR